MWQYNGSERPPFAEQPAPGQESVWDYPRPPALVSCSDTITVLTKGRTIATTQCAQRVLETASPPTYYIPAADVEWDLLQGVAQHSWCEWKGKASYWALANSSTPVAWSYEGPHPSFAAIDGCVSFYPALVECFVNNERVTAQPGGFYGGWVTQSIAGPIKGAAGTGHW